MPRYDYVSMGFYTYDCLGWPFTEVPPGGGTVFIDELTLAVSGAGGTAAIAAAKMGLNTLAVAGVGDDLMGDWVLQRLQHFGVDTSGVQRQPGWKTSSSIVLTRADGSRPALHRKGATADFFVTDDMIPRAVDTKVFHAGGVGLMDAMDKGRSAVVMKAAKAAGAMTTVDVFAGSPKDLPAVAAGSSLYGLFHALDRGGAGAVRPLRPWRHGEVLPRHGGQGLRADAGRRWRLLP